MALSHVFLFPLFADYEHFFYDILFSFYKKEKKKKEKFSRETYEHKQNVVLIKYSL